MEISFNHMYMNQKVCVNKTNFHVKGFAPGLALKQRGKTTRKSPIDQLILEIDEQSMTQDSVTFH